MGVKEIGGFFADAGNAAKDAVGKAIEKTILAVDQNDDGKINIEDVAVVADAVGDAVKKGAVAVKEGAEERRKRIDIKMLQPVFPDTLDQTEFFMSKFIRVTDRDKKHAESDACQDSISFLSDKGGLRVVNLFRDSLDAFRLSFYPDSDCEFYYVNPTDKNNYISLDEYFSYLKMIRINELQRVAQSLGAKHFKVTYKEERTSFSTAKKKVQAKVAKAVTLEGKQELAEKKYSMSDVAAELSMDGHAPPTA